MRPYAFLLYPFALLYDLITRVRNWFFDWGWLKSSQSPIPSILVGNLRVGGTGKTPMVEYLIEYLKSKKNIATLSRGYGRSTHGFLQASESSTPSDIGDEPFQIYEKYRNDISVFVGEDRFTAAFQITEKQPNTEVLLLDDAFQHRSFQADLNILLTTYDQPFFSDFLLPMGRLRESRSGAKRANLIVVTKSPRGLDVQEKDRFQKKIKHYNSIAPILYSSIDYGKPVALQPEHKFSDSVILVSGIADDKQLKCFVSDNYKLLENFNYPDHHDYQQEDFERIKQVYHRYASKKPVIITTEKDAVKVKSSCPAGFLREIPIFVLPIQVVFSPEDEQIIERFIDQVIL
ncbi:tetraacyldisaccharide 4'-kinase [Algoriphagus lutimaris]|uniref:tetraacyldisaccharide 4'-kinase n=1 Tax=Algoriphagus lutimaris TaxID=613197 RepID=UPI00196A99D6|nr:tetraacyldisaccharide 4'-kinase [Algoriphagus lutimaris]MBN3519851.1 tetraacyldisaccharide 4'-kinase [Algoriphagus lutimaris]